MYTDTWYSENFEQGQSEESGMERDHLLSSYFPEEKQEARKPLAIRQKVCGLSRHWMITSKSPDWMGTRAPPFPFPTVLSLSHISFIGHIHHNFVWNFPAGLLSAPWRPLRLLLCYIYLILSYLLRCASLPPSFLLPSLVLCFVLVFPNFNQSRLTFYFLILSLPHYSPSIYLCFRFSVITIQEKTM